MGWKRIGNGLYFYRSRREGGRVRSEYFGTAESGLLMAQIITAYRQDRLLEKAVERDDREEFEQAEKAFVDWFDAIEHLATGAMVAAGFHKHRGQWRRRRNGEEKRRKRNRDHIDGAEASGQVDAGGSERVGD
jgi:hypothetical protein